MECGKEVVFSPVTEQLKPESKSHRIQGTEPKMDLKKCVRSGSFERDMGSRVRGSRRQRAGEQVSHRSVDPHFGQLVEQSPGLSWSV